MAFLRRDRRGVAGALGLPRDPHAAGRERGAVPARHRRGDRYRREGNVFLARRAERRGADLAPRGHRLVRARCDRAQPALRRAETALVRRPDVPPRAAAEGTLPRVLPVWRRGVRLRGSRSGRRTDRDVRPAVARTWPEGHPARAEQHRLCRRARPPPRRPCQPPAGERGEARCRREAPPAQKPAARARL